MASSESLSHQLINFDIDRYVNPWVPHNRLSILPKPVTRFLGYRAEPSKEVPPVLQWPITFLATVAALCLVAGITKYSPGLQAWDPPLLIGSLGASCVLDFNAVRSPLAQPRNSIGGNTLSAIVGVAIAKLFQLNPDFENISWVAGAVGCACASVLMSMTNTVHPPGGATALLASTNVQIVRLGWRYVPLVLLGSSLLVAVALIFNNLLRQYPIYWWTPAQCGRELRRKQKHNEKDVETGDSQKDDDDDNKSNHSLRRAISNTSSERTLGPENHSRLDFLDGLQDIRIETDVIQVPAHLKLSQEEMALLDRLQQCLQQQLGRR